jgi:hypothetical protein
MQGTPWRVLINKSTDIPFYTVAKKLNNIVVLQSWNGLNLQQEMKLENNPFMQMLMKSAISRMVDKVE